MRPVQVGVRSEESEVKRDTRKMNHLNRGRHETTATKADTARGAPSSSRTNGAGGKHAKKGREEDEWSH